MTKRPLSRCCNLGAPPCPICRARAVEQHLARGRSEMALPLARGLADAIVEMAGQKMWRQFRRGAELGQAAALETGPGAPAEPRETPAHCGEPRSRLAALCAAFPAARALAARVLKVRDRDLDAIIAGRVKPTPAQWKRLWAAVDGEGFQRRKDR